MSKIQFQAYALVVIMALTAIVSSSGNRVQMTPHKTHFQLIPMNLGPWTGMENTFDETTTTELASASLLLRYYTNTVFYPNTCLAIVYGTDIGDFHQPEVCLQGQGYKPVSKHMVTIYPKKGKPFDAVAMIMQGPEGPVAFLFWFYSKGQSYTSLGNYQIQLFFNKLAGKKPVPSAMIRLSAEVRDNDNDAAIKQLTTFASDFTPYLEQEFNTGEATKGNY